MPVWRSTFEAQISGRSPAEIRDLVTGRDLFLSRAGLRCRITGVDELRARLILGAASDAPLLRASLVAVPEGTRVVGRIHWAALIGAGVVKIWVPMMVGLAIFLISLSDGNAAGVIVGALMCLGFGWLAFDGLRSSSETREGMAILFANALTERFGRP